MDNENNQVKILIIVDSPTHAEELRYILENEGYQVMTASNGKDALEVLKGSKPDVIISDIIMPEINGFELCRHIKSDADLSAIPVILLTSLSDPADVISGLQCGADNFIVKPYNQHHLLSRIKQILLNHELQENSRTPLGVEIHFAGQKHFITSEKKQILDLLISTYESAVQKNSDLIKAQEELKAFYEELDQKGRERTAALSKEIEVRRQAEEALQGKTAFLEAQVDSSIDGILVVDAQGKKTLQNQRMTDLLKIPKDIADSKDDENQLRWVAQANKNPEQFIERVLYLNAHPDEICRDEIEMKDGTILDRYSSPVTGKGGEYYGRIWTFRDITERKLAVEALKEQLMLRERLTKIAANVPGVIYAFLERPDGTACFPYVSPTMEKYYGAGAEDVMEDASLVFNLIHPDDRACTQESIAESARTMLPWRAEFRVQHPKKGLIWIKGQSTPERQADGSIVWHGFMSEITERKLMEEYGEMGREVLQILNEKGDLQDSIQLVIAALKTRTGFDAVGIRMKDGDDFPYFVHAGFSKDFLLTENTLIERASDGGVCQDKEGNICLEGTCGLVISGKTDPANPLFTAGGSFWTNDSFPMLEIPPDEDPRLHPRNRCILEGYASAALIPLRDKDRIVGLIQLNDRHKGRFTLNTIQILEGIATHIGSALMRKQVEAEREKLEVQLRHSQKMEAVGTLAGGIAHDFNNILNVVIGYATIVRERLGDDDLSREQLDEVLAAADKAASLTKRLLTFSRKQVVDMRPVNVNEIILGIEKMLSRIIRENIDFSLELTSNKLIMMADGGQIEQVLINLVSNALYSMSKGGKLTISTGIREMNDSDIATYGYGRKGTFALISVLDTGSGMDAETQKKIFEPFFTTKNVGEGTGLGLSIVYGIIKQHDGYINVYSDHGKGAEFKIYLPLIEEETAKWQEAETVAQIKGGTETILLAEDDASLRSVSRIVLESFGYSVITAEDGQDAIIKYNENGDTIRLVILDMVMPKKNGKEAYAEIKHIWPDIKAIFVSGYAMEIITREELIEEGVAYIPKPVSPKDLLKKVREVLDR
jgi:PAS domain S-box-containing protein